MMPAPLRAELLRHLPTDLQLMPSWLPWIALPRGNGKLGKAPSLPAAGRLRPVDCRRGGVSLHAAIGLMERHQAPGLGIILTPQTGWVCIDVDGEVPPWASLLQALMGERGYAEFSPSRRGVHVWLPVTGATNRRLPGVELIAAGFVTVTGAPLTPAGSRTPEAVALRPTAVPETDQRSHRDDEWVIQRLLGARNGGSARALLDGDTAGYPSPSEADLALVRMLRFWTQDPVQLMRLMRNSGLCRAKWGTGRYLERTIDRALALGGPVWGGTTHARNR